MLGGQDLGGSHQTGLEAIVERHEHRQGGNHRLARPHITLEQTVHLLARTHIGTNLAKHTLLGVGEFEGDEIVEVVEVIAYSAEMETAIDLMTHLERAHQVELQIEQFLELETVLGATKIVGIGREVDLADGLVVGHQLLLLDDVGRQGFGEGSGILLKIVEDNALDGLGIDAVALHLLRGIVHTIETRLCLRIVVGFDRLDFGMGDAVGAIELLRLAENQVFPTLLHTRLDVFDAIEPDAFDDTRTIGEKRLQMVLGTFHADALFGEEREVAPKQDERQCRATARTGIHGRDIADAIDLRLIDIAIRVITQQLLDGMQVAFLFEELGLFGPYAGYVLKVAQRHQAFFFKNELRYKRKATAQTMDVTMPTVRLKA